MRRWTIVMPALSLLLSACAQGTTEQAPPPETTAAPGTTEPAAAGGYPDPNETLQWTIAFGPGGGNDIMSRTIIDILQQNDLYPGSIAAENREGGSGARGWGHVYENRGNPYHISTTSGSFITTPLQADTPWQPTDFTPIALLAADYLLFLVPGDSPYESLEDFIADAQESPPAIGGIGTINVDFIVPKMLSQQAGFDFEYVSFNDEGELTTALLSKSLHMMVSNPAEVLGLVESGDMKALAFSGSNRMDQLPDVPTLTELGYDIDVAMPRGLILAPEAGEEAQQWWIETMQQVVETEAWREYITTNNLVEDIRYGEDFFQALSTTQDNFRQILIEAGVLEG